MTEHHDPRILRRLAAAQQHQPAKDPDHDQVEQPDTHEARSCRNQPIPAKSQATAPAPSSEAVQPSHYAALRPAAGRRARRFMPATRGQRSDNAFCAETVCRLACHVPKLGAYIRKSCHP
jgi:hypothetical protein